MKDVYFFHGAVAVFHSFKEMASIVKMTGDGREGHAPPNNFFWTKKIHISTSKWRGKMVFRFGKKLVLDNLIFSNYKVKTYSVNKHSWDMEVAYKFYCVHNK